MPFRLVVILFLLIFPTKILSQIIFEKPLSPRNANYKMDVILDTALKIIQGSEILTWRNISNIPIKELHFHLYMNAFRNKNSTFLSKSQRRLRRWYLSNKHHYGGIDIEQMFINKKYDLTNNIEYIRPDDGNIHDSTVIRVPLPKAVLPGEEIELNISFRCRLPRIIARTGYVNDFFLLGQWFPKIGVIVDGEWNCHQFHANSEFFADFGVYDVKLTFPGSFEVGASGILMSEHINDSLKIIRFHAEDVHDFAIAAWPQFQQVTREIEGSQVKLLYTKEHSGQVERYFKAIEGAMLYLSKWLMPYPYPNLTIVDVPLFAYAAAGMEYPCFITTSTFWGIPTRFKIMPEEVTIHEFVHQYFYGIIASNEFEEPWLDEGFTSYATNKVISNLFGIHSSAATLFGMRVGQFDRHKVSYMKEPDWDVILKPAWEFTSRWQYGTYVYDKAMLVLQTLENLVGEKTMNHILRTYVQRWRFRHPQTTDFLHIVNEFAPNNMDWFFEKTLQTTETVDYSVDSLSVNPVYLKSRTNKQLEVDYYESKVIVKRQGSFSIPVDIAFSFSDGDTLIERWNGIESEHNFVFKRPAYLLSVQIDPKNKIWLDLNWTNNSYTVNENKTAFYRHWLKVIKLYQHILLGGWTF